MGTLIRSWLVQYKMSIQETEKSLGTWDSSVLYLGAPSCCSFWTSYSTYLSDRIPGRNHTKREGFIVTLSIQGTHPCMAGTASIVAWSTKQWELVSCSHYGWPRSRDGTRSGAGLEPSMSTPSGLYLPARSYVPRLYNLPNQYHQLGSKHPPIGLWETFHTQT